MRGTRRNLSAHRANRRGTHRHLRKPALAVLCFAVVASSSAAVAVPRLRWRIKAPVPTARLALAAAAAGGQIYAIGGDTIDPGGVTDVVEVYSPQGNRWTTVAPLPEPRYRLAAATGADGRIYAIGGDNPSGLEGSNHGLDLNQRRLGYEFHKTLHTLAPCARGRAHRGKT